MTLPLFSYDRVYPVGAVVFVLLSAIALAVPETKSPAATPARRTDLSAVFERAYGELLAGNEGDILKHRQIVAKYVKAVETLKERRGSSQEKLAEYQLAIRLYEQLISLNTEILNGLRRGSTGDDVRQAMASLSKVERQIQQAVGERPQREWLTLQEVELLRKRNVPFQTPEPGVLPFDRRHWKGVSR